jgi:putative phosphotransacetylase
VSVRAGGERGLVFDNVLVRVRSDFVLEMHIDTDEANAGMLNNGQMVEVFRD